VLLWVAVTMALWATLPLAMYLSHWQWFGWMPRITAASAPPNAPHMHNGSNTLISMMSLLLMSTVVMAVVLWLVSLRRHDG
jgi:hypothetical protein